MPLKRDEAFWKEGMDEKRFALCCIHKIWICLAAALAGAVFAAGIYLGVRQLTMGPKQYRSEVLYSIVYDIDEDDEVLKEFINEYNAYTWGDMMRSDRVMDTAVSYTHLRAHETRHDLVCRLLLEKKKQNKERKHLS